MSDIKTLNIDGQTYQVDEMGEEARQQLLCLRFVDQEITRLKQQVAVAQTARLAYAKALKAALDSTDTLAAPKVDDHSSFNFSE